MQNVVANFEILHTGYNFVVIQNPQKNLSLEIYKLYIYIYIYIYTQYVDLWKSEQKCTVP